jgi:hypothetical protein
MNLRSLWRITSAVLVFAIAVSLAVRKPVAAQQQSGIVGTWGLVAPDGNGGKNFSWYTFTANGQYKMVSSIVGGRNNGNVIQRWGTYQARSTGANAYQVAVRITGGAPSQVCAAGQGCTPIQGIQRQMSLSFQATGNGLRQSDGTVFQRSTVPAQLQGKLNASRNIAPVPQVKGGARYHSPPPGGGIAGIGPNCDNDQQNRICTVNGGNMYRDKRGCMVCAGP